MGKVSMADILQMSVSERIQLAEDIWDSLAQLPEPIALTDDQKVELDRRLEDFRQFPNDNISWDSLKSSLLAKE